MQKLDFKNDKYLGNLEFDEVFQLNLKNVQEKM